MSLCPICNYSGYVYYDCQICKENGGVKMREIKFRGMKKDGKWVYGEGCFISNKNGTFIIDDTWLESECSSMNSHDVRQFSGTEIKPETLGQYTGLKDCEGKEIYEGDIVFVPDHYDGDYHTVSQKCSVVFEDGQFYAQPKHPCNLNHSWFEELTQTGIKVIGNVHENPELLEVGHDSTKNQEDESKKAWADNEAEWAKGGPNA